MTTRFALRLFSVCALILMMWSAAEAGGTATLVYDVPTSKLCWLEKTVKGKPMATADMQTALSSGTCPAAYLWNSHDDYFRTGSVVRLLVFHARYLSKFEVELDGHDIHPQLPVFRGVVEKAAEPAAAPAAEKKGGTLVNVATTSSLQAEADLTKTMTGWRDKLEQASIEALATLHQTGDVRSTLIRMGGGSTAGSSLGSLKTFLTALDGRIKAKTPWTRERFVALNEQTSLAVAGIAEFNKRPQLKGALDAFQKWDTFDATSQVVTGNVARVDSLVAAGRMLTSSESTARATLTAYLQPNGTGYQAVKTEAAGVIALLAEADAVNTSMANVTDGMDAVYLMSADPVPYELFVTQEMSGKTLALTLKEVPGFALWGFEGGINTSAPASQPQAAAPKGDTKSDLQGSTAGAAGGDAKPNAAASGDSKPAASQKLATDSGAGTPIMRMAFDVHQYLHANVVAGFVASGLKVREYTVSKRPALDTSGQPRTKDGAPVYNTVAIEGPEQKPQLHYTVGVNLYLRPRDVFPGRVTGKDYATPGILFGYGIDDTFNFFIGPNWELRGFNVSVGLHLGKEKFLAPGTIGYDAGNPAGATILSDSATDAPVVNRNRTSMYVSAGFDVSVFRSIYGKLVTGF